MNIACNVAEHAPNVPEYSHRILLLARSFAPFFFIYTSILVVYHIPTEKLYSAGCFILFLYTFFYFTVHIYNI